MRVLVLCAGLVAGGALPVWAAEPALTRVTLSSGGVGQYEFAGQVDGAATLDVDVPLDQVDDVLKSLRVDDPAGAASVRLPGRQPLSESFRTLPFGPDAFASPEALLGALVGERVGVPGQGIEGTILAVNGFDVVLPNGGGGGGGGGTVTRHRLTIQTAGGIESVVLEEAHGIAFESEALRRQMGAALAAIAAQRVQDRRTLRLGLAGGGAREVRFGYVVPAPVWKASYRLTVPAEGVRGGVAGKVGRLQGFAVVENLSGRDWKGVEVVLTSGQPVLFHTPLYEAVFTTRAEAPVDVANRLTPAVDQGSMPGSLEEATGGGAVSGAGPMRAMAVPRPAPVMAPPPPAPSPMAVRQDSAEPASVRQSVAQVEFRLAGGVTAASGESLMLPIMGRDVPAERVALYQPETDALHPLVALVLRNDTAGAMPPGVATLYERQADGGVGFIGDARLPAIQPGEERLASFASDLAVRVEATTTADMVVTGAQASGGVLTVVRRERAVTAYRVAMPAGSGRTMLLEVAKRPGWALAEPLDAAVTPGQYRVKRAFAAGAVETVRFVLERPRSERVVLGEAGLPRLAALAAEGGLPAGVRGALEKAAALRTEVDRRAVVLAALRQRREVLVADQGRVRENLGAVPANSELQRRYLAQMAQQETELGALAGQVETAQRGVLDGEAALKGFIGSIAF